MNSVINLILIDNASIVVFLKLFKLGFIHPDNAPGTVKGIIIGIWRFEIQIILGFWDKHKQEEMKYHA